MRMRWMTMIGGVVMFGAAASGCGSSLDSGMYGTTGYAAANRRSANTPGAAGENPWVKAATENTSTFSIDVDNGSYTLMRQAVENEQLPDSAGVRPEEYINFFDYGYPEPPANKPFSINMEVAPSKFGKNLHMLRIGLQGRHIPKAEIKPTNLVFLIDTSGSMQMPNKLPLVKKSLDTLVDNLRPSDTIGIVAYAGSAGVVLRPTAASQADKIHKAIDNLEGGGSTNGEAGIVEAYKLAEDAKINGGNNRVILATDGDFNVGKTGNDLIDLIQEYRAKEISITTIGYGTAGYNDGEMEQIADKGNGNYFFVDTEEEANRIFGPDLASTLEVIAADVKIQVAFDPEAVVRYRLVGYDNRVLANKDFANDAVDAGEIGPGHTVTALYEVELAPNVPDTGLLASVKLRYKDQYGDASKLLEQDIKRAQVIDSFDQASDGFRFACAVAEYAEILRHSQYSRGAQFDEIEKVAKGAFHDDDSKTEFVGLVGSAASLWNTQHTGATY